MAPFQAVPSPAPVEHPSAPLPDVSTPGWDRAWLDAAPAAPAVPPAVVPAARRPAEALRMPAAPSGPQGNPAYQDWTRPSSQETPPATTAIPEREISRGRGRTTGSASPDAVVPEVDAPVPGAPATETYDERSGNDESRLDGPAPDVRDRTPEQRAGSGSDTGVVGGRAALREGRRAAEEERRREARRNGVVHVRAPVPGTEEDEPRPARHRGAAALVAVVVVALTILGVYSFASPETEEASGGQQQAPPTSAAPVVTSGALPPLDAEPLATAAEVPTEPVRVPVTVLNATNVNGLAGDVADVLAADGWETRGTGPYEPDDVAVTTVYYTDGVDAQRWSAEQMRELHPEVAVVAVRFFDVTDVPDPGLVVVAAGDWQP